MTIKQKAFISLKKKYKLTKSFKLEDIRREIWIAQGKNPKEFFNKQGYYMVAISSYVDDGLLERKSKNTYLLTSLGIKYSSFPNETNKEIRENTKREQEVSKLTYQKTPQYHENKFSKLIGRKIVNVRFLQPSEIDDLDWQKSSLVLELDDKTCLIPQMDDEGNDAGAMLHYDYKHRKGYIQEDILYTI